MKFWRQDEDLDAEIGHHLEASTRDRIARGIVPQMGRAFLAEEFQPGHDQVAIISHRVWHRFSGDTKTSPRR